MSLFALSPTKVRELQETQLTAEKAQSEVPEVQKKHVQQWSLGSTFTLLLLGRRNGLKSRLA